MKNPGYGPATQWYVLRATPPNAAAAANFSLAAADNGKSRRRASLLSSFEYSLFWNFVNVLVYKYLDS